MKRIIIWSSVGFLVAAIGVLVVKADVSMHHGWVGRGRG